MSSSESWALTAVAELARILTRVGPTRGSDLEWPEVEANYGTRFPTDYMEFISAFGCGSIEEQLAVRIPGVQGDEERVTPLSSAALAEPVVRNWSDPSLVGRYRLEDMLIWGEGVGADTLCWIAEDSNPDKWPVAVYARSDLAWTVYECGMVEFILRLLRDDFSKWPLTDESLRGWPGARFLHEKDEKAALEQGNDPWA